MVTVVNKSKYTNLREAKQTNCLLYISLFGILVAHNQNDSVKKLGNDQRVSNRGNRRKVNDYEIVYLGKLRDHRLHSLRAEKLGGIGRNISRKKHVVIFVKHAFVDYLLGFTACEQVGKTGSTGLFKNARNRWTAHVAVYKQNLVSVFRKSIGKVYRGKGFTLLRAGAGYAQKLTAAILSRKRKGDIGTQKVISLCRSEIKLGSKLFRRSDIIIFLKIKLEISPLSKSP